MKKKNIEVNREEWEYLRSFKKVPYKKRYSNTSRDYDSDFLRGCGCGDQYDCPK